MELSIVDFFEAGVHFGHKTRFWDPKMAHYIYSTRQGLHIIDLEQTIDHMSKALEFLGQLVLNGGRVIVVGTKWVAQHQVKEASEKLDVPYVNYRWPGGMLTNFKTIRQSTKRLIDLEEMLEKDSDNIKTKKERLQLEREIGRLEQSFGGIKKMNTLPDAVIVLDVGNEVNAVKEANKLGVPVIGIVDTNNSPDGIDYVIPGNDDSHASIALYLKLFSEVIEEARRRRPDEDERVSVDSGDKSVKIVRKVRKPSKEAEKKEVTAKPKKEASNDTESKSKTAAAKKPVAKAKSQTATKKGD
ncbi:MAG: 30S ribosomal protein S2 [Legionellales bacterium]|jgi:small subunit ribosomal protein S2|nr:30S ribosomal protein S2 [Legionellales bacterium]OUX64940.1 MAG: 30S ribosomal protein S2 [Gammaproteobacteria bacterium TMED281]